MALLLLSCTAGCTLNDPYRPQEEGQNIFYTTFDEPPRHLDPARSYSEDEYTIIAQIYEPLLQYHYLNRPYSLIPFAASEVPEPRYFGAMGQRLPKDAGAESVKSAQYTIKLRGDLAYAPHPAFAKKDDGSYYYDKIDEADLKGVASTDDFKIKSTRNVVSDDYIYQIKRLADPLVASPIYPVLERYILGFFEFNSALRKDLEKIRAERKAKAGASYNQTTDERINPITLDYDKHPLAGAVKIDDLSFKLTLKTKYPQFVYWLAMPFFSPVPKEAVRFYAQKPLIDRNITLDRFPVGSGPYFMKVYNPNMEMALERNPNFHKETFPESGESLDLASGLLGDAGKPLPFIDRIVFKLEKESIPRWNKFLQGYFDNSGITSDSFDSAIAFSALGGVSVSPQMEELGIRLHTSVRPSTYYTAFNMADPVVGGLSDDKRKLRQAISIAIDYGEFIEIFNNGRGIQASSPIPPGINGYVEGKDGVNEYVFDVDKKTTKPRRKSIEYAKKLLAEAGYPGGMDKAGRPLTITFDNSWTGADSAQMISWYIKRFRLLGIQLENRTTDYNRFQEKVAKGNFQFLFWGWNADYPDPENFLFLLYGPNGKAKHHGENVSNYESAEFDRLFKEMENMDSGPKRLSIIKRLIDIIQKDAPWAFGYHPVSYGLYHGWVSNVKPNAMANNSIKYLKIDLDKRRVSRDKWNSALLLPIIIGVVVVTGTGAILALINRKRRASKTRGF